MTKDYYNILGISKDADQKEIKQAFRRKAKELHPDSNPDKDTTKEFKEVNEAFSVLSDEQKRRQYDQFGFDGSRADGGGPQGFSGFGGGFNASGFEDLGSIFGSMFSGGFGGHASSQSNNRGNDLSLRMKVEFEEAIFGAERDVSYTHKSKCDSCSGTGARDGEVDTCNTCGGRGRIVRNMQTMFGTVATEVSCSVCNGKGKKIKSPCPNCDASGRVTKSSTTKIKIPAGAEHGMKMRFPGKGDAGKQGGTAGDLYVTFDVKQHETFTVENGNVFIKVVIEPAMAVLGDEIDIPTVNGDIRMKIPKGTQSGKQFKLNGKGAPKLRGGVGDQYVTVEVQIPKKLSSKEKKLWEELKSVSEREENVFQKMFG